MFDQAEVAKATAEGEAGTAVASSHGGRGGPASDAWGAELGSIAGFEWPAMAVAERVAAVRHLSRVWRVASAAVAAGLASLDGVDLPDHADGLSAGGWWAHDTGSCGRDGMWLVRAG